MIDDKTHFIGVLPPLDIERIVEGERRWVEKYGCRSGHSTPPHVTLVPPFSSRKTTDEIRDILLGILPLLSPFMGRVDGYGSFGSRTIFLRVVPQKEWNDLSSVISKGLKAMGESVKVEKKPLAPHLTVANRDIPSSHFSYIFEKLSSESISSPFPVESVSLFHREGRLWRIREEDVLRIGM